MVERLTSIEEIRRVVIEARRQEKTIGFVPTMGAIHEGHLSLVRESIDRCDVTVVSIFVNPTQFGADEDFDSYPRDVGQDVKLLEAEGVDFIFTPSTPEMYPQGAVVQVDPGPLAERWCGESRPGHFAGVATVVAKLFNIVDPDLAFFGEKDFQQLKIIEALARDLAFPVKVVGCPTIRDRDGVALSTRNDYLSVKERQAARLITLALRSARDDYDYGTTRASGLVSSMEQVLGKEPLLHVEYVAVVDPGTLEPLSGEIVGPARALVAARVGDARLIDNLTIVD